MAKLLVSRSVVSKLLPLLVCALAVVSLAGFADTPVVIASNQTGNWTGYAYGNCCGAGGTVDQGTFANHDPMKCPTDPAASWAFGSQITMVSPSALSLFDGSGNPISASSFILRDVGDLSCSEGKFWVDIYFGRNATSIEFNNGCACGGSPFPGVCNSTNHSNCTDAINWGTQSVNYNGP